MQLNISHDLKPPQFIHWLQIHNSLDPFAKTFQDPTAPKLKQCHPWYHWLLHLLLIIFFGISLQDCPLIFSAVHDCLVNTYTVSLTTGH